MVNSHDVLNLIDLGPYLSSELKKAKKSNTFCRFATPFAYVTDMDNFIIVSYVIFILLILLQLCLCIFSNIYFISEKVVK